MSARPTILQVCLPAPYSAGRSQLSPTCVPTALCGQAADQASADRRSMLPHIQYAAAPEGRPPQFCSARNTGPVCERLQHKAIGFSRLDFVCAERRV